MPGMAPPDLDRLKPGRCHVAADLVERHERHALDRDALGLAPGEGLQRLVRGASDVVGRAEGKLHGCLLDYTRP
jgi:hypothetical protein